MNSPFIIQDALETLKPLGFKATVFQSRARLPAALKGLPDLYLMKDGVSYWVEVKAKYNGTRDQLSDAQWQWYHDRRDDFNFFLRYAIVETAEELIDWATSEIVTEDAYMSAYYKDKYKKWLEECNENTDTG